MNRFQWVEYKEDYVGSDIVNNFTNEYPFYVEEVVDDWQAEDSHFFCYTKEDMLKLISEMEVN